MGGAPSQALQPQQVAAFVGNGNGDGPLVGQGFGFGGSGNGLDVGQFKRGTCFHVNPFNVYTKASISLADLPLHRWVRLLARR
jgi:hypothetical protein